MFDPSLENTFVTFGLSHLFAVLIVFSLIALVIINRERLRQSKYVNHIRIGLVIATLGQEVSLNVYRIVMGEWSISTSLPLQLCGLGILTTSLILLTKSEKLFQNVFFIMMIGATMALITPGIEERLGFPHYRFFQFFVSHGLIVINFAFILFVFDFQKNIRYRHLLNSFVVLLMIAAVLLGINLLVDGNYMYLLAKPGEGTAFDLFGVWPWYIVNIFFFGIPIFFHLFYLPFFIRDYRRRKRALA